MRESLKRRVLLKKYPLIKEKGEEGKFLKHKGTFGIALILALALTLTMVPMASAANGPKMANLLCKLYAGADQEFTALENKEIDFTDWSLTKYWSDRWKTTPYSGYIKQVPYAEMGMREFDLNNQRWPTGVMTPRTYDLDTDSYKNYFDGADDRHSKAMCFRVAINRLTNKPAWSVEILKGYGKSVDSFVPDPAAGGWIWPGLKLETYAMPYGLGQEPYNHPYSTARANEVLNAAGFTKTWYGDPDGGGPLGTGYWRADPFNPGNPIPLIIMYVRSDDPLRLEYGRKLRDEFLREEIKIPIDYKEAPKSTCFDMVMVKYLYHIYTGGWGLGADPDYLFDLWDSMGYWGGTQTSSEYGTGWSTNYAGFCNYGYDDVSVLVKYPPTYDDALLGAYECQKIYAKYVGSIPLYSNKAVMAYRDGWSGAINFEGAGVDNGFTYLNAYNPTPDVANTIRYGMMSGLEHPNVITSEWTWDWAVIGFGYESLIGLDPFNLAQEYGWLAMPRGPGTDGVLGTADDRFEDTGTWTFTKGFNPDTGPILGSGTTVTFTLRDNAKWHDGTPVTPQDVQFSIIFTRDCGPGVAWNYMSVMDVSHVDTHNEDPNLGLNDVKIYFNVVSYWAAHWAGYLPIIAKHIWIGSSPGGANSTFGWGYPWPSQHAKIGAWPYPYSDTYGHSEPYLAYHTPGGIPSGGKVWIPIDPYFSAVVYQSCKILIPVWHGEVCNYYKAHVKDVELSSPYNNPLGGPAIEAGFKQDVPADGYITWSINWIQDLEAGTFHPELVRDYAPYETWDLSVSDGNLNGIADAREDGCGPWKYYDMDPTLAVWVSFTADPNYFKRQGDGVQPWSFDEIYDYLVDAYHKVGDVNYDKTITTAGDGVRIARAGGTNKWTYPWDETGTIWDYYNPHADVNTDGYVGAMDLYYYGTHYMAVGWPPYGL